MKPQKNDTIRIFMQKFVKSSGAFISAPVAFQLDSKIKTSKKPRQMRTGQYLYEYEYEYEYEIYFREVLVAVQFITFEKRVGNQGLSRSSIKG